MAPPMPGRASIYFAPEEAGADGVDGHVGRGFNLLQDFVVGDSAEGVDTAADQDDFLTAVDAVQPVEGIVEGVVQVRFAETGHAQVIQGVVDGILIRGEVNHDAWPQVVADHGDKVVLLHLVGEGIGGAQGIVEKLTAADLERRSGGKLDQQHGGKATLGESKTLDGLRHVVLQDAELFLLQSGNELAVLGQHQCVHGDQRNIHIDGVVWHALGGFGRGRRSGPGGLLVGVHLGESVRSGVALRAAGFRRRRLLPGVGVLLAG